MRLRRALIAVVATLLASPTTYPSQASEPKVGQTCPGPSATASYSGRDWVCVEKQGKLTWQLKNWPVGDEIYYWIPRDNLVTAAISRRITSLRKPEKATRSKVVIQIEGKVPEDALKSIRDQYTFIVEAFPEVFKDFSNRIFIYQTTDWARKKAVSNKCPIPSILEVPPQSAHSEAVPCKFAGAKSAFGSFLNWKSYSEYDPAPTRKVGGFDEWANQIAQEGGGSSIQSFYNKSRSIGNSNPLPAWYEQGGQNLFTSIALAVQSRKWRQATRSIGGVRNCGGFDIAKTEFYGPETRYCEYDLGAIGNELLIALYGFDGPIAWFQAISLNPGAPKSEVQRVWNNSFKSVYGIELSKFYLWANAYGNYMASNGRVKLPSDLVSRLNQIKGN